MATSIDLTGDSGVVKTILVESKDGEIPEYGNEVDIHYIGKLDSGDIFDSSYDRGIPLTFILGRRMLMKGCDIAVGSMRVGEKALVVIQPHYGYGESGFGPNIPPNSVLHFEVELISARVPPKNMADMSMDEMIQTAANAKENGNNNFLKGNYGMAVKFYEEGARYSTAGDEWPEETKKQAELLKLQCHLNLANSYLKLGELDRAEINANRALKIDPTNIKGLYRRATARFRMESYTDALKDLSTLLKLDPKNGDAVKLYHSVKLKKDQMTKHEKKYYSSLFKDLILYDDKKGFRVANSLPKTYLQISIGEETYKIVIALFDDTVPKTVKNFQQLCDESSKINYKGNKFHRLIKGFMIQGGDITKGDGTGGVSIYGESFEDESFDDQHTERGLVSMANCGPNTNNSQFFITFAPCQHLDGKHVIFGCVIDGLEVLDKIEAIETDENDRPLTDIVITGCGSM